jgi:predicted nucleic acid-binding protein
VFLVDTSVWIDYFRRGGGRLEQLLLDDQVLIHPCVIGELACGNLGKRREILANMRALPLAPVATDDEVLGFIETHQLMGRGIGYIDAHLLTSARLNPGTRFWTRDRRLAEVAAELEAGLQ